MTEIISVVRKAKFGLDNLFIAECNNSDNNLAKNSCVPSAETKTENQVNNTNPNTIMCQISSAPMITIAANAPDEIKKDAIYLRINSENKIKNCVQKRKMDVSLATDSALSSFYALSLIHTLSSSETMPAFH